MCLQDTVRIPLGARGPKAGRFYALVDAADAEWANQWRWSCSGHGYAYRLQPTDEIINGHIRYVPILLHRELLGLTRGDGIEGDHINHDRLDNRRTNLRAVPKHGNRQNQSCHQDSTSKFRGVDWRPDKRKWRARVNVDGKTVFTGHFDTEAEAAEAARAARSAHLPYAVD